MLYVIGKSLAFTCRVSSVSALFPPERSVIIESCVSTPRYRMLSKTQKRASPKQPPCSLGKPGCSSVSCCCCMGLWVHVQNLARTEDPLGSTECLGIHSTGQIHRHPSQGAMQEKRQRAMWAFSSVQLLLWPVAVPQRGQLSTGVGPRN